MTELGSIEIKDETSIVAARNKIRILTEDLNFDTIGSTRLATITSELGRMIHQEGDESSIAVSIEKYRPMRRAHDENEGPFGLKLIFQSKSKDLPIGGVHIFFDEMRTIQTKDGFQNIEAVKFIPDPAFHLTDTFVKTEREKLMRVSKAEVIQGSPSKEQGTHKGTR